MTAIIQMDASELVKNLGNLANNLPKQLGIVSSKVSRKTKSLIAKDISKTVAVKQKDVKKQIITRKKGKTTRIVELKKSVRIPLKNFGARQTKKGVSYRIDKRESRKKLPGAFTGPRPGVTSVKLGGHVYRRRGKSRLPIQKLFGPSPWGVFVKNSREKPIKIEVNLELKKQLAERIRYLKLKKAGTI